MIAKFLAQLLGNGDNGDVVDISGTLGDSKSCRELHESEDGDWIIINIHENYGKTPPEMDPLENLLIEHPSMSVYKLRFRKSEEEGLDMEQEEEKEKGKGSTRSLPARRLIPWRMTVWASVLGHGCCVLPLQASRARTEHRRLTRGALRRRNLAETRFSMAERCYGHFKQPCQRVYNF
ncbi:tumor protein p53-inducible nuclear protein 2-like [Arapaima gigas]